MFLLTRAEEIDIEQDTVAGILDSALRLRGGGKTLAKKVGMSAVELSYIRRQGRMPRMRTARRIGSALPLSAEQRDIWLHHVERYWQLKNGTRSELRQLLREIPPQGVVAEIRRAHSEATSTSDPIKARKNYLAIREAAELLFQSFPPSRDPINYVELGFVMHDVLCVLNRNIEGLWYAKRVRRVIEAMEPREYHAARPQISFFPVNAIRAEGVSFHNLKLYRRAFTVFEEAEKVKELAQNEHFWRPYLNRDKMNALAGMSRFPISGVEALANQASAICKKRADAQDSLLVLLISESLARAYIKHGNYRSAEKRLYAEYDQLAGICGLGSLHQVLFFRTFAWLYWKQGVREPEWEHFISQALRIGVQAGLEHQVSEIRLEYGEAVEELYRAIVNGLAGEEKENKPA